METFIQQYPKIDAVFCQDDDVLLGVLQAIKESGRTDIKIALGGAGSKAVYQMIMNNDPLVRATTLYHPMMIADGIQYAVDVALGTKSDSFNTAKEPISVVIPSALIDKSNVAQYYNADSSF
jgi:ribose transport system substrate-binding protein